MKLKNFISEVLRLSQQEEFDPNEEVFVDVYDDDGENTKTYAITKVDWLWSDPCDVADFKKILTISVKE